MSALVMVMVFVTSCSHLAFWRKDREPVAVEAIEAEPAAAEADHEAELKKLVRKHIESTENESESQRERLIRKKPYFYREYGEYPEGTSDFEVVIQETESRTAPYNADVVIDKVRFATRFHRKRDEAREDRNFLRDTGTEKITFEYRNGRWVRLGSIFVADKTEECVNGEWVPVEEEVEYAVATEEEESKGWLRRTWYAITGR